MARATAAGGGGDDGATTTLLPRGSAAPAAAAAAAIWSPCRPWCVGTVASSASPSSFWGDGRAITARGLMEDDRVCARERWRRMEEH